MTFTIENGTLHLDGTDLRREPTSPETHLIAQLAEAEGNITKLRGVLDTIEEKHGQISKTIASFRGVW